MTKITPAQAYTPALVNVLIACEESQAECKAFREAGFNAYSCDIQPSNGGHPEWHIHSDVSPFLDGLTTFTTESGEKVTLPRWHLIIAHPPCTYLCKVSSVHMRHDGQIVEERLIKMIHARDFFLHCMRADCDYLAVENPLPMRLAQLPPPDTFLHPYWFGVKYTKKTLYWLRNLPPIMPELEHSSPKQFVRASRGKYRSRTFPQVAAALARQWGNYILDDLSKRNLR